MLLLAWANAFASLEEALSSSVRSDVTDSDYDIMMMMLKVMHYDDVITLLMVMLPVPMPSLPMLRVMIVRALELVPPDCIHIYPKLRCTLVWPWQPCWLAWLSLARALSHGVHIKLRVVKVAPALFARE